MTITHLSLFCDYRNCYIFTCKLAFSQITQITGILCEPAAFGTKTNMQKGKKIQTVKHDYTVELYVDNLGSTVLRWRR